MNVALLQTASAGGSLLSMILPFVLIFVIFYFFIIRPQNKKQKETKKMIDALKKGDKIVTIGGIYGVVSSTKENTVIVKVDDGAKIEFSRSAVSSVITDSPVEKPAAPAKKEKAEKADKNEAKVEAVEEKTEETTEAEK